MHIKLLSALTLILSIALSAQADVQSLVKLAAKKYSHNLPLVLQDIHAGKLPLEVQDYIKKILTDRYAHLFPLPTVIPNQSRYLRDSSVRERLLQVLQNNGALNSLIEDESSLIPRFSSDGRYVLLQTEKSVATYYSFLFNIADDPITLSWTEAYNNINDTIVNLAVSPDNNYAVMVAVNSEIYLLDLINKTKSVLQGHEDAITSVAFSPDGKYVLTGSLDNTACVWDVTHPQAAPRVLHHHNDPNTYDPVSAVFSSNGRFILTGFLNNAYVWNATDQATTPIITVSYKHHSFINSVTFSPNGKYVLTGSRNNKAYLWDLANPQAPFRVLNHEQENISSVAFSPDEQYVLILSSDDNLLDDDYFAAPDEESHCSTVCLWDLTDSAAAPRILYHNQNIRSVVFSPDGKCILAATLDGKLRVSELDYWLGNTINASGEVVPVISLEDVIKKILQNS